MTQKGCIRPTTADPLGAPPRPREAGTGIRRLLTRDQAGFTLLELLVVVVILGILAATALFSYRSVWPRIEYISFTNQLQAAVNRARSQAIRRQEPVQVQVVTEPDGQFIDISFVDANVQGTILDANAGANLEGINARIPVPNGRGVVVDDATFNTGILIFERNGEPRSLGAFQVSLFGYSTPPMLVRRSLVEVNTLVGTPRLREITKVF